MKSLTEVELDLLIAPLKQLTGARLQKVFFSGDHRFAFEFYLGKTHYWVVDLTPTSPMAFLSDQIPIKISKKTAPLQLFVKAHFAGKHLKSVKRDNERGRVLQVEFAEGGEWEIRLYPHGQNFSAKSAEKSIYFHKPKPEAPRSEDGAASSREARTMEQLLKEWGSGKAAARGKDRTAATLKQWTEKRKKLKAKLAAQLAEIQPDVWKQAGELLKSDPLAELSKEVREGLIDIEDWPQKVAACFAEEKKLMQKKIRLEKRIQELDAEMKHPPSTEALLAEPTLKKTGGEKIQFKTFVHGPNTLWVGRSGADNLKLLRSAKAWYLWLHVKDEPGAHGIVRLNRGEQILQRDLQKIGENFLRMSLSEAAYRRWKGSQVEIILAEVRHVRPIKGDRLGRVRYSKSKILTVSLS